MVSLAVGMRVVVRYRLPDGRATDALGPVLSIDDDRVVVHTIRGDQDIALVDVIAAKEVPPAPERRAR